MLASVARRGIAFALVASPLFFGTPSFAEEPAPVWQVGKASGDVWLVTSGTQNAALTMDANLKEGDSVRTGKTGRVMLKRGEETILIAPNSVVGIPAQQKAGSTTIIQQAGSILLEVNKRDARTFEVETPYLVAAVKGTQFRVSVGPKGANVNVSHGSVEVADVKTGKFALVLPGQSANVSGLGTGLSLHGIGTLSPIQNGAPRPTSIDRVPVPRNGLTAPSSIRAVRLSVRSLASAPAVRGSNGGGGLRIATPIGQVRLDVNTATKGLAREAGIPAAGRSTNTIWNSGTSINSNATIGGSSRAAAGLSDNNSSANSVGIGTNLIPAPDSGRGMAKPGRNPSTVAVNGNSGNGNGGGSGNGNNGNGNGGGNGNGNNGNGNGNGGGNGNGNNGNGNGDGGGSGNSGNGNGGGPGPGRGRGR